MEILGVKVDFDVTSPLDIKRYKDAGEAMEAKGNEVDLPDLKPDDPGYIDAYIEMLNAELLLFGDFIDEVFGDGVANELMDDNPSLNTIADVNDALVEAFGQQGKETGVRFTKYTPNRKARRKK